MRPRQGELPQALEEVEACGGLRLRPGLLLLLLQGLALVHPRIVGVAHARILALDLIPVNFLSAGSRRSGRS
jgi:hypothetical protein